MCEASYALNEAIGLGRGVKEITYAVYEERWNTGHCRRFFFCV